MPIPKREEVFTFTGIKSLAHLLDAGLRVLINSPRQLACHCMRYLLIEKIRSALESLLLKVLEHRIVNVSLGSSEVIKIDN